jgi:hypothetical protein
MTATNSSEGPEDPTTSNLRAAEIALSDLLKPETRKARLYLLGVSMVGITIVYTGLVPQQLTTLGITFGEADRRSLLFILALVILYFLAAFVVYGGSDFIQSRLAFLKVRWADLQAEARRWEEEQLSIPKFDEVQAQLERTGENIEENLKRQVEKMVAELDERKRRVEERVAAGLSEEEAAKQVDVELQEESAAVALRSVDTTLRPAEATGDENIQAILEPLYRKAEETGVSGADWFKNSYRSMYDTFVKVHSTQSATRLEIERLAASAAAEAKAATYGRNALMLRLPPARAAAAGRTLRRYAWLSPKVWYIKTLFEFLLPIFVGLYAIYALVVD